MKNAHLVRTGSERVPVSAKEELEIEDLLAHAAKLQDSLKRVMREGRHYGIIPGSERTDPKTGKDKPKPTLLRAGRREALPSLSAGSEYEILPDTVQREDFIGYSVRCTRWHIPTGRWIASGIGPCNFREAKYRCRFQPTDREVPKEY